MKIITYSDLHLEFWHGWELPEDTYEADLMILAGDITVLDQLEPLVLFLESWNKPALYVPGNHEYYSQQPMELENQHFKSWLSKNFPHVHLLLDESITLDGINFFGGTMWTDFDQGHSPAMAYAQEHMSDFQLIRAPDGQPLTPLLSTYYHQEFKIKLVNWLSQDLSGPRIVISHHAPVINPNTKFTDSPLRPAFNSLDMQKIIEEHDIDYWIYGHTHECDDQTLYNTRVLSNQLGYPNRYGGYECETFDPSGVLITL